MLTFFLNHRTMIKAKKINIDPILLTKVHIIRCPQLFQKRPIDGLSLRSYVGYILHLVVITLVSSNLWHFFSFIFMTFHIWRVVKIYFLKYHSIFTCLRFSDHKNYAIFILAMIPEDVMFTLSHCFIVQWCLISICPLLDIYLDHWVKVESTRFLFCEVIFPL